MQKKSGAECLNLFLQKIIGNFFDKWEKKIQLCLCVRVIYKEECPNKKIAWNCLSGTSKTKAAVKKVLKNKNSGEELIGKQLDDTQEYFVCAKDCPNIKDFRIESQGKCWYLSWLLLAKESNEAIKTLLQLVINELIIKIDSLFLLDNMVFLWDDNQKQVKSIENIINTGKGKFFFGNLLNREWLVSWYCREALKKRELPDWHIFMQISAMFYEKRSVKTRLYFCNEDWKGEMSITFHNLQKEKLELNMNNLRTVRKLMEMAGEGHGLLVRKINGKFRIEGIIGDTLPKKPPTIIEFSDHMIWRLKEGKEDIFEYCKDIYRLSGLESKDDGEKQLENLERYLIKKGIETEKIIKIVTLLKEKSIHGSSIVFIEQKLFQKEVQRLFRMNKAYWIRNFDFLKQADEIAGIAAIDGAIIMNINADKDCLAVGAILDGESVIPGNAGRGARYNSVTNYIHVLAKHKRCNCCFAAIISEDGMLNIEFP